MKIRYSEHDVTARVKVNDPQAVKAAVLRIFTALYPDSGHGPMEQAFDDVGRLFGGEYPGYHASDTAYHDLQHSLDMTLATARVLDGYERSNQGHKRLGPERFLMGVISGLFHDSGYIRHRHDTRHRNGAEYTHCHVTRSAQFLKDYLPTIGMKGYAGVASRIVHFTGYEKPLAQLRIYNEKDRFIGCVLATADLLAQMSDRCYLEKCRDRLYSEFVIAGLNKRCNPDGTTEVIYASGDDLLAQTPQFFRFVLERLDTHLDSVYRYLEVHFKGRNPYMEELLNNMHHLDRLMARKDLSRLRRRLHPVRHRLAA
ncbi:MAG: hypothetical protein HYU77_06925 [Betaproteobacteria bacterium]|nr:hypothetical protein [Betaproteobacteria bacterium]